MTFGREFFRLWRKVTRAKPDYGSVVHVASMSDVPDDPEDSIYIVGTASYPKWAVFRCPCGQHRLTVPLMRSVWPHWTLRLKRGAVTLWPSVSVDNDPCSSHFWLRGNRIEWARWV